MDICRNLLELHQIYGVLTQSETQGLLDGLEESKIELTKIKIITLEKMFNDIDAEDIDEGIELLSAIKEQMEYVKHNIKVVEDALMCHHTKCSEKRTLFGKLETIWLN